MRPSLLRARKRLAPLAWLLAFAVLTPVSTHLARGVVLCIGRDHVDIEIAGPGHHDGSSDEKPGRTLSFAGLTNPAPVFETASEDGDLPCLDVPLRVARAADPCHQAAKVEAPNPVSLGLTQPSLSLETSDPAEHCRFLPRPASLLPAPPPPLSTVVLLI